MAGRLVSETLTKLSQMGDVTLHEPAGDSPHKERARRSRKQEFSLGDCIAKLQHSQRTEAGPQNNDDHRLRTQLPLLRFPCRTDENKTGSLSRPMIWHLPSIRLQKVLARSMDFFFPPVSSKARSATQDKIIDTADIIRNKQRYRGYIHLKIMPGIEYRPTLPLDAMADRISVNLEAPTSERPASACPQKSLR